MKTLAAVDYLQYSTEYFPQWVGENVEELNYSSMPGYRESGRTATGVSIHAGHPTKRYLVVVPGTACAAYDISPAWVRLNFPGDGRVSRIDFAVTVHDERDYIQDFARAARKGEIVSQRFESETPKAITDVNGRVETFYLSNMKSRAKKGVFRAYDKKLESGLEIEGCVSRFELEVKRNEANTAFRRWANGATVQRIIRDVVDIPNCEWWVNVMGEGNEPMKRYADEPQEPQTMAWLVDQVAPALAKIIVADIRDGTENEKAFRDAVQAAVTRLTLGGA